jgi:hypothetical protein
MTAMTSEGAASPFTSPVVPRGLGFDQALKPIGERATSSCAHRSAAALRMVSRACTAASRVSGFGLFISLSN